MRVGVGAWAPRFHVRALVLLIVVTTTALILAACGGGDEPSPTPTATESATSTAVATATEAPTASATATEAPTASPSSTAVAGPPAPTDVVLTGRLPDTSATVTPGEAESGRVSIEWSYSGEVEGFRIYQRDCGGELTGEPIEMAANERRYGPLQPCRPGGEVGVAAFDATGESEVVWAVPGEAP